jgi:hypothetical protein
MSRAYGLRRGAKTVTPSVTQEEEVSNRKQKAFREAWALIPVAALCVSLAGCGDGGGRSELAQLLPDPAAVAGVGDIGEVIEYEEDTLYDFLNGGAELYFDYGIVTIASTEYSTAAGTGIEVSVYDMNAPAGAFGIYSNVRYTGADFVSVGNEGMLSASSLDFWKGRYYCRLVTFDMEPETQAAMLGLGKALAANIKEAGSPPDVVGLLPRDDMVARSEKYFTRPIALNNIRYVSSDNILNLGEGTRGAAAQYSREGSTFTLILIEYGTEGEARAGLDSFREHAGGESGVLMEQSGRFLAGVWDLEGEAARDFLGNVRTALEQQQ